MDSKDKVCFYSEGKPWYFYRPAQVLIQYEDNYEYAIGYLANLIFAIDGECMSIVDFISEFPKADLVVLDWNDISDNIENDKN